MSQLTFFGAAENVTGSKHLLEVAGARILLDCGTFQGLPDIRERNRSVPFPPESIDALVSGEWQEILPGVRLKFYDAGHILGSAVSVLSWEEEGSERTLAYTGDLGPNGVPLLHDPETPEEKIDTLIMESTYGDRVHDPFDAAYNRLAETIVRVCERGGKIIVPAFSLGRTQVLVYIIHKLTDQGRIPRFPIFVDSPLATNLTDVYKANRQNYDEETVEDFGSDHTPLAFRNLRYVQSANESKELNIMKGPFMVIAGSGMMTGGRVVHHLRHSIDKPHNAVFITGYQAEGTLGRRLLEGASNVDLYGVNFPVNAEIFLFNEFSAHADSVQLASYASSLRGLTRTFLVHGEHHQADALRDRLLGTHPHWDVQIAKEGRTFSL